MIADKNEAFHHNSCKKLAQLSKVIYAMNAQKQDRADLYYDLIDDFDEAVIDTINQHQFEIDTIFNSLYKYRKSCISSSCKHFGTLYKQTKADYANFISDQEDKYINLLNEIKEMQKTIRNFQLKALQAAANFLDNSEEIEKDIATRVHSSNQNSKNIRKELRPILEKTVSLEDKLKSTLNRIKMEYKKKKQDLNSTFLIDIHDLYGQYIPFLLEQKNQLNLIKEEITTLKSSFDEILKMHSSFSNNQLKSRNSIIADTNQTIRLIQKQIQNISDKKPSDVYFRSTIRNLQQIRIQNQLKFKQKVDLLTKEAHQIKHQRHSLKRSKSSQMLLLEKQFSDQFAFASQNFDLEKNQIIDSNNYHLNLLAAALNDTQNLFSKLSQLISKSTQTENAYKINLVQENGKIINSTANHYETFLQNYQKNLFSYIDEYEKLINQINYDFSSELKSKEQCITQMNELQIQMSKKIESKILKSKKEIDNYKKVCEEKRQSLIKSNESLFIQKTQSKLKKMNEIKNKFNSDLNNKEENISKEKQLKIQEKHKCINDSTLNLSNEISEHNTEISKLKAKAQFFDQQIEQMKKLSEKKIEVLDQQIMNLDKSIRQFQRSVKTETQKIDEDYEIQIQIKQVDLNNKIENISKLYTKEENQRGIEIIEEIRRIKDSRNLMLNQTIKKTHDKEDMINNQKKRTLEMKAKIEEFRTNHREDELKGEIEKLSKNKQKIVFNLEKNRIESISKIKKEIESNKEKINKKIESIDKLISSEKKQIDNDIEHFNLQKLQMQTETKGKIDEIDQEYENKLEKIRLDHQKEIKSIQNRIKSAQKTHDDYLENSNKEKDELIQKLSNEAKIKKDELYKKLIFVDSSEQDYKAKTLIITKSCLLNPPEPFTIRKEEESSISNLEKKIQQKTKYLSMEFSKHIENMTSIFNRKIEEDTTSLINKCLKLSRSEAGNHKKMPQLVTPQLVF